MLLDILIVLLIIGGVAFGFWRGLWNLVVVIVGIYLGALLGRFVYEPIAQAVSSFLPLDLRLLQLLVFLLLIAAVTTLLLVGAHALWGSLKLPYRWGQTDLVGGMLLGAVAGVLAALFLVLTFGFLISTAHVNSNAANYPFFSVVQTAWSSSLLRAPMMQVGHVLYYSLLPSASKTTPDILKVLAPQ
jgi:membrane protein required for colicin V production